MVHLPIYLDHNATTPCDPRVLEAMIPYFTQFFGNAASRTHPFGWQAEEAIESAREQVADLIGAEKNEIVFTSGATEADNLALKGIYEMYGSKGNHIITSKIEHKAVLDTCRHLERLGAEITYINVKPDGIIDLQELEEAIKPATILVSVMYANNETGVIQPIKEISRIARNQGALVFSDASQAAGKLPINVRDDGIDLLALTAHKMYGPKGTGALYVRRKNPRVRLTAQMDGGGHERGMRSGTLNVPGIVGFGRACELCSMEMKKDAERMKRLRDKLEHALLMIEESYVNGNREHRLPNVCNISFRYVEGQGLLMGFNKVIAVSSGSACTSASIEPSYVLKAMGLDDDMAHNSIRFSLGKNTTEEQIDYTIEKLSESVKELRAMSPLWEMHKGS